MVQLVDDNDVSVSVPCRQFAGEKMFYATANELNRDASATADVLLRFPFPPKDCNEATLILQNMDDEIKTLNEKIASGTSTRPAKRYLDAFLGHRNNFKNWLNAKQCVANALKAEDDAFAAQLQSTLDKESASQSGKKGVDNLIIFGGLALLLGTAIFIIVKKSKSS